MRQGLRFLLSVLLSALLCSGADAVLVTDLYTGRTPIEGAAQGVTAKAAARALAQVFVKVSGSEAVLTHDEVKAALEQAKAQMKHYSYHSVGDGGRELEAVFNDRWVNSVIAKAGASLWTANRPAVLIWVVLERNGEREFVDPQSNYEQFHALQRAFEARGLPIEIPLFDLQDAAALTPDQAWSMSSSALRDASARYEIDNIVVGRFSLQEDDTSWAGDWAYLAPQGRSELRETGQGFLEVAKGGAALVAEPMAQRYAVATSGTGAEAVTLHVTGIRSYADYAQVMQLLERLELIERVDVVQVADDTLSLLLTAQASANDLAGLLELNRQMTPLKSGQVAGELSYLWTN